MATEVSYFQEFTKGFYKELYPVKIMLGLCPTLAVSTAASNGIGMGLAATFVLVGSNVMIALIRNIVPPKIRLPIYIVVIATFVSIVDMLMAAYTPALSKSLGIYIPLIVVNCIIIGRAEVFACRNSVFRSLLDGLGVGFGFTIFITLFGSIRELLGNGTLFGLPVMGSSYEPMLIMILPPGAFILFGIVFGFFAWIDQKNKVKEVASKRVTLIHTISVK